MKRLPLFALAWLVYIVLTVPLLIIGIPVVAVLALFPSATVLRPSEHYNDGRRILAWRWSWVDALFGNDEDGIDGFPSVDPTGTNLWGVQGRQGWWVQKTAGWSRWRTIVTWAALRNSNANLRFLPFFGIVIDPSRVTFRTSIVATAAGGPRYRWWLAWQGYRAGFRIFWNDKRAFWFGWKVMVQDENPDATALPDSDSRKPGAGFAFQPYGSV